MLAGKREVKKFLQLKKNGLAFLTLAAFFIWPMAASAASSLIINEIMYDLPDADQKHEWIELYNAGSSAIDLTGWKLNDGNDATDHALNPPPKNGSRGSLIMAPGEYLLLADDATTVAADLPNYKGSIIDTAFSLSNSYATLSLINKEGQTIYSAYYSKQSGAAGNGKTLEWDGIQFKESADQGGTPGGQNSISNINNLSTASPIASAQIEIVPDISAEKSISSLAPEKTRPKNTEASTATTSTESVKEKSSAAAYVEKKTTPPLSKDQAQSKSALSAGDQNQVKNFTNNTFLWLVTIIILSSLVALPGVTLTLSCVSFAFFLSL